MFFIKKEKILMIVIATLFMATFLGFSHFTSAQTQSISLSADPSSGNARLDVIFTYILNNFPSCGNRFYLDFCDGRTIVYDEPCGNQAPTVMAFRMSSIVNSYSNPGTYNVIF